MNKTSLLKKLLKNKTEKGRENIKFIENLNILYGFGFKWIHWLFEELRFVLFVKARSDRFDIEMYSGILY